MVLDISRIDLGLELGVGAHELTRAGGGVKQGGLAHRTLAAHLRAG